ncbi:MAG TPA: hypothetical protein VF054_14110 [Micromonosporaceae bacterium]
MDPARENFNVRIVLSLVGRSTTPRYVRVNDAASRTDGVWFTVGWSVAAGSSFGRGATLALALPLGHPVGWGDEVPLGAGVGVGTAAGTSRYAAGAARGWTLAEGEAVSAVGAALDGAALGVVDAAVGWVVGVVAVAVGVSPAVPGELGLWHGAACAGRAARTTASPLTPTDSATATARSVSGRA